MARQTDRLKRSYVAGMHEVRISRSGDCASIEYLEPGVRSVGIRFSEKLAGMTDADIQDGHHGALRHQNALGDEFAARLLTEVPLRSPQIGFHWNSGQWTPGGDVLKRRSRRRTAVPAGSPPAAAPSDDVIGMARSMSRFGGVAAPDQRGARHARGVPATNQQLLT